MDLDVGSCQSMVAAQIDLDIDSLRAAFALAVDWSKAIGSSIVAVAVDSSEVDAMQHHCRRSEVDQLAISDIDPRSRYYSLPALVPH